MTDFCQEHTIAVTENTGSFSRNITVQDFFFYLQTIPPWIQTVLVSVVFVKHIHLIWISEFCYVTCREHKGRNYDLKTRDKNGDPWYKHSKDKTRLCRVGWWVWVCLEGFEVGWDQVSVVSAGVDSVPEHSYVGKVVSDAGVVLNVVEPPCHVHVLLLLLDG